MPLLNKSGARRSRRPPTSIVSAWSYSNCTGKRPFELPTNAPLEAARIVCTSEPAKTGLPADLDAILRKCLRKEPAARYTTVAGLREDLERALRGEAVAAYQGAWTYRAGKWIRRYKWAVAAAALVATTLAGGIIATARQAAIAQRRYEDVRRLARTVIFDVYDQVELLPAATKARETIANTALQYLEGLSGEAKNDPDLAMELAEAYLKVGDVLGNPRSSNLGRFDDARKSFDKANALYEQVATRDSRRSGVNRGRAQVLLRRASLATARADFSTSIPLTVTAEKLELTETNDDAKRDWPLLVRVAFERLWARSHLQGGGPDCKNDAKHLKSLATRW